LFIKICLKCIHLYVTVATLLNIYYIQQCYTIEHLDVIMLVRRDNNAIHNTSIELMSNILVNMQGHKEQKSVIYMSESRSYHNSYTAIKESIT